MKWFYCAYRVPLFAAWFIVQVVSSNVRVVVDVLTRKNHATPIVMLLDSDCRSEAEAALLSILISLTPGTLVLSLDKHKGADDLWDFYVHAMYDTRPVVLKQLHDLESRILHAVRGRPGPRKAPGSPAPLTVASEGDRS